MKKFRVVKVVVALTLAVGFFGGAGAALAESQDVASGVVKINVPTVKDGPKWY